MRPSRAASRRADLKEEGVRSKIRSNRLALVSLALLIALLPAVANAQAIIKVNDVVNFKLGIVLQAWADWQGLSDAAGKTAGFQQNLFLRRARFLVGGQVAKDVTFFFMTDNPNLGKATAPATAKSTAGFIIQDAFVEWAVANEFRLQGGLILIPLCRNCNSSAHNLITMDYGTWSFQNSGPTGSSTGRDTGFQVKGFLADDHLEYRAGAYQGFRNAGVKNAFRYVGRLQYNVFDVEKGQFYTGTYFGKKKILAIGGGYDAQSDYSAYAGDVFFDFPVGKNGITAQVDYIHYDGGTTFTSPATALSFGAATTALLKQDDIYAEAGFFISSLKLMPFLRYESQNFSDQADKLQACNGVTNAKTSTCLDRVKYQAGFGWYPYGSNFNIKAGYTRTEAPDNRNVASTNQYTIQVQVFYY
jgi:hypothetical protein